MIISPKHKFVFLATPKTGSTSIHQTLLDSIKDNKLIDESKLCLGHTHMSCPDFLTQRPKFKKYFKFAFVRNPWDRVLSWYFFRGKKNFGKNKNVTFRTYIKTKMHPRWHPAHDQYEFTKNCDFIGRLENLQQDFDIVCDKIGIPSKKLPHKNKSKHTHYTEYYDDETRQIVAEKYARDIEYFGYKFGE